VSDRRRVSADCALKCVDCGNANPAHGLQSRAVSRLTRSPWVVSEVRLAARRLYRQPSFTLAAVGALTLGIAAATSIFAAVQAALLQPLG